MDVWIASLFIFLPILTQNIGVRILMWAYPFISLGSTCRTGRVGLYHFTPLSQRQESSSCPHSSSTLPAVPEHTWWYLITDFTCLSLKTELLCPLHQYTTDHSRVGQFCDYFCSTPLFVYLQLISHYPDYWILMISQGNAGLIDWVKVFFPLYFSERVWIKLVLFLP